MPSVFCPVSLLNVSFLGKALAFPSVVFPMKISLLSSSIARLVGLNSSPTLSPNLIHQHRRPVAGVDVREPQPVPCAEARRPVEAGRPSSSTSGVRMASVTFAPSRSSSGSSTSASREAVTWMERAARDQAITLSTCRRSRTYWNASACSSRGVAARDAERPAAVVGARHAQRRRSRSRTCAAM